jgi:hypothetical protein
MPTRAGAPSALPRTVQLGLHWPTVEPILLVAHHLDQYPPVEADRGIERAALVGRRLGADTELWDGWRRQPQGRPPENRNTCPRSASV